MMMKKKKFMLSSKKLFLTDRQIDRIDNLVIYEKLEELYLQRNNINTIEKLDYSINLQILSLHGNNIKVINGIKHLVNLKILDLSENLIQSFDIQSIPKSIEYLYMFHNPFFDDEFDLVKYRYDCINYFGNLFVLDSLEIKDRERLLYYGRNNFDKHKQFFMKKLGMDIIMSYDKLRKENDQILEDVKKENVNVENFDLYVSDEKEHQEKELLANLFMTSCKELMTQYHKKIDKIKEAFPRNSDFKDVIESSKLDLLKLKYKFEEFVKGRTERLGERINDKLDTDNKIMIAEEKIRQIEEEVPMKERPIDHTRIRSQVRQEILEVEEEYKDNLSAEDEKEEENIKEDI